MAKVKEKHKKKSSSKVEIHGWRITESMEHTDGYIYYRIDCSDDGLEWYEDGNQGILEYRISKSHPEIAEELEEAYQKSKQGYPYLFSDKKKKKKK
jgi:hypothetical protein